jgi:aminopeptidase YwaD
VIERWTDAVREGVSGERALADVHAIAGFHRVQCSPGYDAAAGWMAESLARAGLRVEVEHVPGDGRSRFLGALMPEGWECTHATATLHDGAATERLCDYGELELSLILRSAPAAGRFRIVALEDGTEDEHYQGIDVRDCVVLTRGVVHRVLDLAVRDRGAAGILFDGRRLLPPVRGPFDDEDAVTYTSFWWNTEEPRGWGFVVSPAVGLRLRERLRSAADLRLDVKIESRAFPSRIPLLSATIPGSTDEEALVVSHLCHPRPSANDNASGAAANLEAARTLATLARTAGTRWRRGVRFLWVPELTGTYAWLAGHSDRATRTVGALNLDMVGEDQERCGSTFLLEHPPCFSGSFAETLLARTREQSQDWVTSYSGPGHYSLARLAEVPYSGGSDHAVFLDPAIGVPCPMLIQWPDRFYHSSHDTPDRCDPRSLALAARSAAAYAGFLAGAGDPEIEWLTGLVARRARARLLEAADTAEPGRAIESERLRGTTALASLARLGVDRDRLRSERRALDAFCLREGLTRHDEVLRPEMAPGGERVPVRRIGAPLEYQRHLLPAWPGLPREQREAFRRFESGVPGGGGVLELAWAACDGTRTLDDIARLVWLESGHHDPDVIERFFSWTERLGLSQEAGADD